jgi:hypothetical protein
MRGSNSWSRERKNEHCSSGPEEEAEDNGHIPKTEGHTGDEKPVGRGKGSTRRKTSKEDPIGAITTRG